eukprot:scaffold9067_cov169-Ochromonas_danica.AAC.1
MHDSCTKYRLVNWAKCQRLLQPYLTEASEHNNGKNRIVHSQVLSSVGHKMLKPNLNRLSDTLRANGISLPDTVKQEKLMSFLDEGLKMLKPNLNRLSDTLKANDISLPDTVKINSLGQQIKEFLE